MMGDGLLVVSLLKTQLTGLQIVTSGRDDFEGTHRGGFQRRANRKDFRAPRQLLIRCCERSVGPRCAYRLLHLHIAFTSP
jgi:hypothetical protein